MRFRATAVTLRVLLALSASLLSAGPANAAEQVNYLRDIKPIFAKYCYSCHGAATQKSRLRLDTAALALKGGKSGPIILPGKSKESKLLKAVTGTEGVGDNTASWDPALSVAVPASAVAGTYTGTLTHSVA